MKSCLFIFTSSFPCDEHGEIYLWNEIPHLANEFEAIYLLPKIGEKAIKPLPKNCFIISQPKNLKNNLSIISYFQVLIWVLKDYNQLLKKRLLFKLFRYNFSLLKNIVKQANYYSFMIKKINPDNIYLYSYWLSDYATIVSLIKKDLPSAIAISRAHGYDIFENQTSHHFIPFRKLQFGYLDHVYSVSKSGAEYLQQKLPMYKSKISWSYLGTTNSGKIAPIDESKFQIASCSIIRDVKRLDIMVEALKHITFDITWHVIGNGDNFEQLKEQANMLPKNINVLFYGLLSEKEIINFYNTQSINLFVSTSSSEGLPVSMMEAQSFGIPIMSSDVGGCNEICNEFTGFLIDKDVTPKKIADKITAFKNSEKNTIAFHKQCRNYWESYFNAELNYKEFMMMIDNLDHS